VQDCLSRLHRISAVGAQDLLRCPRSLNEPRWKCWDSGRHRARQFGKPRRAVFATREFPEYEGLIGSEGSHSVCGPLRNQEPCQKDRYDAQCILCQIKPIGFQSQVGLAWPPRPNLSSGLPIPVPEGCQPIPWLVPSARLWQSRGVVGRLVRIPPDSPALDVFVTCKALQLDCRRSWGCNECRKRDDGQVTGRQE
jgi:hypothetical protein